MNAVADAATAGRNDPACVTDGPTRPTDRVDVIVISQSPAYLLLENRPTPTRVGFLLSRSTRGRAPSVPLLPPSQIDGGASLPAWSLGGLSREGKEGIAEHERARNERESSARAAGSRTTEKTQGFAKNRRRFRGGLGEMTTPARPSAATLLSLSTCIFGCIFRCISGCIVR